MRRTSSAGTTQVQLVRILDQFIAERRPQFAGNLLITHELARVGDRPHALLQAEQVSQDARRTSPSATGAVFEKLKSLDRATFDKSVGTFLTTFEIQALLARRDEIVSILEKAGPAALFDRGPDHLH